MFEIPVNELVKIGLIFLRVGGILFFLPIFGDAPTPVRVRIGLAAALTSLFIPLVPKGWDARLSYDVLGLGWIVFKEITLGFAVGYIAKLAFEGLLMAANLVGYQMGFGTANLFVPDAGESLNGFTALHRIIMMLFFLGLNLHHAFIEGIAETFQVIPIAAATSHADLGQLAIAVTAGVFTSAVQMSAPILIALLFTMAALGLASRTVPQLNVFSMSFPLSFFIGLLIYVATIPFMPEWLSNHFDGHHENLFNAINFLKPTGVKG